MRGVTGLGVKKHCPTCTVVPYNRPMPIPNSISDPTSPQLCVALDRTSRSLAERNPREPDHTSALPNLTCRARLGPGAA